MTTTYRIQFTEFIGCNTSRPASRDDLVVGDISMVLAHLDGFSWDMDSVVVMESKGSDGVERVVSESEWMTD
jgi:hypothetical protein